MRSPARFVPASSLARYVARHGYPRLRSHYTGTASYLLTVTVALIRPSLEADTAISSVFRSRTSALMSSGIGADDALIEFGAHQVPWQCALHRRLRSLRRLRKSLRAVCGARRSSFGSLQNRSVRTCIAGSTGGVHFGVPLQVRGVPFEAAWSLRLPARNQALEAQGRGEPHRAFRRPFRSSHAADGARSPWRVDSHHVPALCKP